jgi:ribosome biogenesis GTPase A
MSKYQNIQWYPGHMFKTMKELRASLSLVDIVIVLLDARIPISSLNPQLLEVVSKKKILYLLNKSDLADKEKTQNFINHFTDQGHTAIHVSSLDAKMPSKVIKVLDQIMAPFQEKRHEKGLKDKIYKVLVTGIPNVGKSTFINALTKRKATKTGNTPGVTKQLQWVRIHPKIELLDSPGVLWPKFEDETVALNLALTGAIKDKILPLEEVVYYGITFLHAHYQDVLKSRYDIDDIDSAFHKIALNRGALLKGGLIDEDRVCYAFLTDLRNHKLGGLTFDILDVRI